MKNVKNKVFESLFAALILLIMLTLKIVGLSVTSLLTHTSSVVERDLVPRVTTAHITSIGVGTILIASTYTQSTFIYVCVMGSYITHTKLNYFEQFYQCLTHTHSVVG